MLISTFCLISLFIYVANCQLLAGGAKLSMNLQLAGFHRNLKYITVFTKPPKEPCDFVIEQQIPASAYISTDQLSDLQRFQKINYHVNNEKIDVEAITAKAKPFLLYLYGDTASLFVINVPLHFRYHVAGNTSFVKVNIDNPKLFINCHNNRINYLMDDDDDETTSNANSFDYNSDNFNKTEIIQMKCKNNAEMCNWLPIEYEIHSEPIVVNIPIGFKDFSEIVTVVTILASWIGCYYLAKIIATKSKSLIKKIE